MSDSDFLDFSLTKEAEVFVPTPVWYFTLAAWIHFWGGE